MSNNHAILNSKGAKLFSLEVQKLTDATERATSLLALVYHLGGEDAYTMGMFQMVCHSGKDGKPNKHITELVPLVKRLRAAVEKRQFDVASEAVTDAYNYLGAAPAKTRTTPGYALHVGKHPLQKRFEHLEELYTNT